MKPLATEWMDKAEGDYLTAQRELMASDRPNYDAACFHAQQCCEKYFKARLVAADIAFPKTHDLGILLNLLIGVESSWEFLRSDINQLATLAVEVRYPGYRADAQTAQEALRIASLVRNTVRQTL